MNEVTDQQIIEEAVRLVNEGLAVTMLVKGRSMLPFILGGQESAVLTAPGDGFCPSAGGCWRFIKEL